MWSAAATPLLLLLGLTVVLVASVSNSSSYSFGYSSAIQPVGLQDLMDLRSRENLVGLRSINSSNYADDSYGRNRRRLGKEPNYAKQVYNPRFHKCKDAGEAYSAAYLITKEHVLQQKTNYNLTWVNCEMASFIMMNGKANPDKNVDGTVLQTLDVFELSVVHLSAYERLQVLFLLHSSDCGLNF